MSDRLKSTNTVSNEEVIEDLTKDLERSLNTEESVPEYVIESGSTLEDFLPSGGDAHLNSDVTTTEDNYDKEDKISFDNDGHESDKDESDTDSIDEESLKDAEVDLTDDEKADRRLKAEEFKTAGNEAFKVGDYETSIEKYTEGLRICPLQFSQQRSILYCNRSASKMKLEKYKRAIKDCTKAIELDDKYLKAYYYRRAQSYEATEKLDECLADFKKILELDPLHKEAQAALVRLPPMIEEKNEKLKKEMLGKLKDLGNMILRPFGLSTDNFQLEQDPNTQGYKINFKQFQRRTLIMAGCRCRRRKRTGRTVCRSRSGRFKRCRHCDRRYRVRLPQRRRRSACRRRRIHKCRSRSIAFRRCACNRRQLTTSGRSYS